MAKPLRLPGVEEQYVLDELEIQLLVEPAQQARWNRLVKERHYLRNATLAEISWMGAGFHFFRPPV